MHAQRQPVSRFADLLQHIGQGVALVAKNVKHRAEDFLGEFIQPLDLDQGRGDESAAAHDLVVDRHRTRYAPALGSHRLDVTLDAGARLLVDHGPHVDTQAARVAELQFMHRAFEHLEQARREFALDAQHPQRRTTLAGAVECGCNHVAHHLFGQCG